MLICMKGRAARCTTALALGLFFGCLSPVACSSGDLAQAPDDRAQVREKLAQEDKEVAPVKGRRKGVPEGRNIKGRALQGQTAE
jgi:hypothetical protein